MNMHPGDLRSIEDSRTADSAQKEETSFIGPPHVSEVTKTPIHIEAGVSFFIGILISRFRRGIFVFAFGAVYAIAFLVFVGLFRHLEVSAPFLCVQFGGSARAILMPDK